MERYTNNLLIVFLISFFFALPVSSQFNHANEFCVDKAGNYAADSTYHNNLKFMLSSLTAQAKLSLFNNDTVGQRDDQTYGLYMCRGDLSDTHCHDCIAEASTTILEKCPSHKEALVWFEECMLRYANRYIFSRFEEAPMTYLWVRQEVSDPENWGVIYLETVNGLIKQAAYNTSLGGYAAGEANVTLFEAVYVVAQCTLDIIGTQCERCLRVALRNTAGCCGTTKVKLAMYLPSCSLQYDQEPIVGEIEANPPDSKRSPLVSGSSDTRPSFESDDSSSSVPPPPSPGSYNGATLTSSGLRFMIGFLMAMMSISLTTTL